MKKEIVIVFLLILLMPYFSIGQKGKCPFFFNEFSISVNRSIVENDNTLGRFGFGFELYKSWMDSNWVNIVSGISYNKTTQYKKSIYHGRYASINNVTYNLHNISIPLLVRFNVGKKILFFSELGGYLELLVSSNCKGTMERYLVNGSIKYEEVEGSANLSSINYGLSFGVGVRIPLKKYEMIIKSDFKYGFNIMIGRNDLFNRYLRLSLGIRI